MANWFGYAGGCSETRPDVWQEDGYVGIGDTGAPTLVSTNSFGTVVAVIVSSVSRTGVGAYTLTLSQPPAGLLWVDAKALIDSNLSPAYDGVQLVSTTIGKAGVVHPVVKLQFNVGGTPTELPSGSAFLFSLRVATT